MTDELRHTTRKTGRPSDVPRIVDLLNLLTGRAFDLVPDVDSSGSARFPPTADALRLVKWRGEWSPLLIFARRAIETAGDDVDQRAVTLLARRVAETVSTFYSAADQDADTFDQVLFFAASGVPIGRDLTDDERTRGADPQRRHRTPLRDTPGGLLGVDAALLDWVTNNAPDAADGLSANLPRLTDANKSASRRARVIRFWSPRLTFRLTTDDDPTVVERLQGLVAVVTNETGTHLDLAFPDWLTVDDCGRVIVTSRPDGLSSETLRVARTGWTSPRLEGLASLLWSTTVRHELRRVRNRRPAIMLNDKRGIDDLLTSDPNDYRQAELTESGVIVPSQMRGKSVGRLAVPVTSAAVLDVVVGGLHALSTPDGHRLRRGIVREVHRRREESDRDDLFDGRILTFAGLEEVATAFGLSDPRDTVATLQMLVAGHVLRTWRHGDRIDGGSLWSLRWSRVDLTTGALKRGRPTAGERIELNVGTLLVPTRAELTNGNDPGRFLVPELRHDVPTGRLDKSLHGAIWTLASRFVAHLVDKSDRLARGGGSLKVPTESRRGVVGSWERLVEQSSAHASTRRDLWDQRDRILGTLSDGPTPLLKRGDGVDHWTLADCHDLERDFILRVGHKRLNGTRRQHGRPSRRKES